MTKIPSEFREYFWDVDFNKIDPQRSPQFIIKRILNRGSIKAIKWLFNNFSDQEMIDTIMISREFAQISAIFWADVFKLDKSKIKVLQKPPEEYPWGMIS